VSGKYPLKSLQRLWQHRAREEAEELRARHRVAEEAETAAASATSEHVVAAEGLRRELDVERERLSAGRATVRDLQAAEAYQQRATAELQAKQARAGRAAAAATQAAVAAEASAELVRAARADTEAIAAHRERWETARRRAAERRREEGVQEQWSASAPRREPPK
jgi:hypothetical protein